jgi:hypothetical protein
MSLLFVRILHRQSANVFGPVNDEDSDSLDEEDLALLEENMGIKLARNEGVWIKKVNRHANFAITDSINYFPF